MTRADRMSPAQAAWLARCSAQYAVIGYTLLRDGRLSVAWRGRDGARIVSVINRDGGQS